MNQALDEAPAKAIDYLTRFFEGCESLEEIVNDVNGVGRRRLEDIAKVAVKFCADVNRFDITTDILLTRNSYGIRNARDRAIDSDEDFKPIEQWEYQVKKIIDRYNGITAKDGIRVLVEVERS